MFTSFARLCAVKLLGQGGSHIECVLPILVLPAVVQDRMERAGVLLHVKVQKSKLAA